MQLVRAASRSIFMLALLFGSYAIANSASAGGKWVYLGSSHVDGHADHDKIKVNGGDGPFRALRFKVEGVGVKFDHVIVRYGNGQQQQLAANFVVPHDSSSPTINLPGQYRNIQSIEMWYERGNWGKNPKVSVYGLR